MISRTDHNVKHVTAFRFSPDLARKNIPQRVSPRDDKYYFPKIATSPLWDIIPETLRVYAFLNLSARQWRTLTWRQVRLCTAKYTVFIDIYTRESSCFTTGFPQTASTTTTDDDDDKWTRIVPIDFALFLSAPSLGSLLCARLRASVESLGFSAIIASHIPYTKRPTFVFRPSFTIFIFIIMSTLRSSTPDIIVSSVAHSRSTRINTGGINRS